jgi:uroporphyrinogen decarboxylase
MNYLGDFWAAIYDQVLDQVDADVCFIWEDMCYKNGPLISPAMFREFMLPNYHKVTRCLRDHGITAIMVDTDGDARQLIPLFIEGGANIVYTCEAQAGMDVVELRKTHPKVAFMGGMDKKVLSQGRDAIDEELERKIPFMLERGGYIPHVDHQTPPDVSWENFRYYRQRLNDMITGGVTQV